MPIPFSLGSWTYRFHGPSTLPGNSSTSVFVHSGGFSQLLRSVSRSVVPMLVVSSGTLPGETSMTSGLSAAAAR